MNAVTSNRHFLIKYKYLILHLEEKKESQIVEHTVLLKNLTNQIGFLHSNIKKTSRLTVYGTIIDLFTFQNGFKKFLKMLIIK